MVTSCSHQSAVATTPALTALNAAHLTGPTPPDHLFIHTAPTSEHLPTLLDNRSWPQILSRYRLQSVTESHLHLARRPFAQGILMEPILEDSMTMGERFDLPPDIIPADAMLWAQIHVRRSLFGGAVSQLYKPAPLSIGIVTADGRAQRWRFVPSLGADGFLLGPLLTDAPAMAAATTDPPDLPALSGRMPRSITLISAAPQGHWHYQDQVLIRLFALRIQAPRG